MLHIARGVPYSPSNAVTHLRNSSIYIDEARRIPQRCDCGFLGRGFSGNDGSYHLPGFFPVSFPFQRAATLSSEEKKMAKKKVDLAEEWLKKNDPLAQKQKETDEVYRERLLQKLPSGYKPEDLIKLNGEQLNDVGEALDCPRL